MVFGHGAIDELGKFAKREGGRKILLVTDAGLVEAGHAEHARDSLAAAELEVATFDQVHENPTTKDVAACVEFAKQHDVDLIVAVGGGSSMDCAKGCNFLLTNGGEMKDYWGVNKATRPMLPFIAVPTTTGTGSEMQSFALISDEKTHQKMACGDGKAAARIAILDPSLATSQPMDVLAHSGLDALSHAVETAVTTVRSPISQMLSRESFCLVDKNLERVLADRDDIEAMGGLMLAAALAGMAIENSMLGITHSMANPLTAHFDVVHGHAVGLLLPTIVLFNAEDAEVRRCYEKLVAAAGLDVDDGNDAVNGLVSRLSALFDATGLAGDLTSCSVDPAAIPQLSAEASKQWTAQFNPRAADVADFERLYRAVL